MNIYFFCKPPTFILLMHDSWKPLFEQYDFDLDDMYANTDTPIYPPKHLVFRVFDMDVKDIRIVLLGQDCYHGPGQAHGLSFSVPPNIRIPPSLRNIFKELTSCFPDRNYQFKHGNLEQWATSEARIFLLNSALTVAHKSPLSHMEIWQEFTDDVIRFICQHNTTCLFLLMGNPAKAKSSLIDDKTRIVTCVHPSPMATGFLGSKVFVKVEERLGGQVNWQN